MILGQLTMGARQTRNAPLHRGEEYVGKPWHGRHEIAKKCQQQQIGLCEQVRCAAKVSVLDFVQPGWYKLWALMIESNIRPAFITGDGVHSR